MIAVLLGPCHGRSLHKDLNTRHFYEYSDHDRSPNKEYCDYGRNPIKTQKHDIFVRTAIMAAVLINSAFCEECDHSRSSLYCDHFMRLRLLVTVLRNSIFSKRSVFLKRLFKGIFIFRY